MADDMADDDYGFEYSDDDNAEEDVDVENAYYTAKGLVEGHNPKVALDAFAAVVKMEQEPGEWGFKALKQSVKMHFKLGNHREMMECYRQMLGYVKSAVTKNFSEKAINSILDLVSAGSDSQALLSEFYETTLKTLEEAKNDRLVFKTNCKLCKLWFDTRDFVRMAKALRVLRASCTNEDGSDDQRKGTQLLEVFALEIQMHTEQKHNKKLKQLYTQALAVKSAIPHPRIMGIIRECGGKMRMSERTWADAATDFFEAFKSYDEAGAARRIQCLKYLVLATMLMNSAVNPFDAQEAKPYKNDPEIVAMTALVSAYQRNDIGEFERILRSHRGAIMEDAFVRDYVEDLLRNIRTQVLLRLIKPYTRLQLATIATELGVSVPEVESLCVSLVLDGRVEGRIDQVAGVLEKEQGVKNNVYGNLERWSASVTSIHAAALARLGGG